MLTTVDTISDKFVFILSAPRSGSTLLRVMLAGHPQLFCPPELHLLPFKTLAERQAAFSAQNVRPWAEGLERALAELKYTDVAGSRALLHNMMVRDFTVTDVYAYLKNLLGEKILVDKSPIYAHSGGTLARAEEIFEDAHYIFLHRHPFSAIESCAKRDYIQMFSFQNENPYASGEMLWGRFNQNILNFLESVHPGRQLRVAYETLVAEPDRTLRYICDMLDVPFDEALLTPYADDRMTDVLPGHSHSCGDPYFLTHKGIEPELATRWKDVQLPEPLSDETEAVARRLGYTLPARA